jgi:glycosyltransferase involved in cell wall biosynthesis
MKKKLNLLFWADSPEIKSGLGIQARYILRAIPKDVWNVYYLAIHHPNFSTIWKEFPGVKFAKISPIGEAAFLRLMGAGGIDAIFGYMHPLNIVGNQRAKDVREMIKNTKTMWYTPIEEEQMHINWLSFMQDTDIQVVFAKFAETLLKEKVSDLRLIPHTLDPQNFPDVPKKELDEERKFLGLKPDTFLILNVCSNCERKDLESSLKVFATFNEQNPNSVLYLFCNRSGYFDIRVACQAMGLKPGQNVIYNTAHSLASPIPQNEFNKIMRSANVLLNTSVGEGFGLPVAEAMLCGTPVVAPSHTSLIEIVGEDRGWLVPAGNTLEEIRIDTRTSFPMPRISLKGTVEALERIKRGGPLVQERIDNASKWAKERFHEKDNKLLWEKAFKDLEIMAREKKPKNKLNDIAKTI